MAGRNYFRLYKVKALHLGHTGLIIESVQTPHRTEDHTMSKNDKTNQARIIRAIASAARTGMDPYNSHNVAHAKWTRAYADAIRRGKA